MALTTNLNRSPYFDDFDPKKNFHEILFKPSMAVQARELTQLQTILQNQITRFGNNILREGTIIEGCGFTQLMNYHYVKLLDTQADGQPVNVSSYMNMRLTGLTTGVEAIVSDVADGYESQLPDLNTLYVKYVSAGSGDQKVFSSTENIRVSTQNGIEVGVVVAAGLVDPNAIGLGYGVLVTEGIVYQKGYFVRVDPQSLVVSKYTNKPDGLYVGFDIEESIVNSYEDTSLLDNARGSPNYNAPGADRLKLTAVLKVVNEAERNTMGDFFTIMEFEGGRLVRTRFKTEYNVLGQELSTRTYEESGDYTVRRFPLAINTHPSDPDNKLELNIGAGLAYIHGNRVETLSDIKLDIDQSKEKIKLTSQDIAIGPGQYFLATQYAGDANFSNMVSVDLRSAVATAATSGVPGTPPGVSLGSAVIKSVEFEDGVPGTATGRYRIYFTSINMLPGKNFNEVKSIYRVFAPTNFAADLVLTGGVPKIFDANKRSQIFPIGRNSISSLTNSDFLYRRRMTGTIQTSGTMNLSLATDQFGYGVGTLSTQQKLDIIMVPNTNGAPYVNGKLVDLTSTVVTATANSLSITGMTAPASPVTVDVYVTAKKVDVRPAQKIIRDVFVKVDCSTHPSGITGNYTLGLPDAIQLLGVYRGTTYSETNADVTRSFVLKGNQSDTVYSLSSVVKRPNLTLTTADKLLIKVRVFQKDITNGNGFFTAQSYIGVSPKEIPTFEGLDLRGCLDFRAWRTPTALYSLTPANATVNPVITGGYDQTNEYTAKSNSFFETDYDFYLGRIDKVTLRTSGTFVVVQGVSAEQPVPPPTPDDSMLLALIEVPPYEALTSSQALRYGKPNSMVKMSLQSNKGYTMKSIADIEKRIDRLEYYTVLNALEQDTSNLVIQDANGLNRFKNGIVVDPFKNFLVSDIKNPEFKAGINLGETVLTPRFLNFTLPMKLLSTTGVRATNDITTLSWNETLLLEQTGASRFRNCVENFYSFRGTIFATPEFDDGVDTTRAPDVTISVDFESVLDEYTEALGEMIPLRTSNSTTKSSTTTTTERNGSNNVTTTTRTDTTTTIVEEMKKTGVTVMEEANGDFVSNVTVSPWMRSKEIKMTIVGMKPNTRHHIYFDKQMVDAHCAPAEYGTDLPTDDPNNLRRSKAWGEPIISSPTGEVNMVFMIPADKFFVGDRTLLVIDIDDLNSIDSSTSEAEFTYRAFNFNIEKTGLTTSTRTPQYDVTTTTSTDTSVTTNTVIRPSRPPGGSGNGRSTGRGDPLAQTFFISDDEFKDVSSIFVTSMDLFFRTKDPVLGATVMIREVLAGQPLPNIVTFGSKYLRSADVSVSNNGSVATRVNFRSPVQLNVGQEYCVIIKPDGNSPEYTVFVNKVGQNDLLTGIQTTNDWGEGMLLTSTNDRTWTSYQDEDLKFKIYRANFTNLTGTVSLTHDNMEFFRLSAYNGVMRPGMKVYRHSTTNLAGTVSITQGSNQMNGVGTSFLSTIAPGDEIVVTSSGVRYLYQIKSVTNNTSATLMEVSETTRTGASYFKTVTGVVAYSYYGDENRLYLESSTAKVGNLFANGNQIRDINSNASATVDALIPITVSYIQPSVYKTVNANASVKGSAEFARPGGGTTLMPIQFGKDIYPSTPAQVHSRSYEISNMSGNPSYKLSLELSSRLATSSPMIDHKITTTQCYEFLVNNDTTGESGNEGEAVAKYISKTVELAPDMDAEDIRIYLSAYRPTGTGVEVYVKMMSAFDPDNFLDKAWTKLSMVDGTNTFSSLGSRSDYRELEYRLSDVSTGANTATFDGDVFTYTSPSGAVYNDFKFFAIKIVMLSSTASSVPVVGDMRGIALAA